MGYCDGLSKSKTALALCKELENTYRVPLSDIDKPQCSVKHATRKENPKLICSDGPDGKVSSEEVYAAVFAVVELEEDQNRDRLRKIIGSGDDVKKFAFNSPLLKILGENKVIPTWIVDDGEDSTVADRELFVKVNLDAAKIVEDAERGPSSVSRERRLALAVMKYITAPTESGGLGVSFDFKQPSAERNIVKVVSEKTATCTEFASLYIFVARQVELHSEPVQIFEDEFGQPINHVGIAIRTDVGPLVLDLFLRVENYVHSKGRWSFIPKEELLGLSLSNRASELDDDLSEHLEEKHMLLDRAIELAPYNYLVVQEYGRNEALQKKYSSALIYLNASIKLNPFSPNVHYIMSGVYEDLNKNKSAKQACEKYKRLGGKKTCN